jgi:very-short-patch-repair endonuclease
MTEIFNNEKTKIFRRELRAQPVAAERILWAKLRKNQLGHRFNRQFGVDKYIVDFYCAKKRLVIEIDGATHSSDEEIRRDMEREDYFVGLGLKIKRYSNRDIFESWDWLLKIFAVVWNNMEEPPPAAQRAGTPTLPKGTHKVEGCPFR